MKQIECVNKNILNYYGVSKANDAIVINSVDEYVESFLKRYVLDCVKSNKTKHKEEYVFRGISRGDQKVFNNYKAILYECFQITRMGK